MFGSRCVGLDIADHTIEVIELSGTASRPKVLGLAKTNLEPGIVERGRIKNEEKLVEVLKKLFKQAKPNSISTNNVIFGLPDSVTYIHSFVLEPHSKSEREDLIKKEIAINIPDQVGGLVYTYKVLREDKNSVEILLTAIRREVLESWNEFFKKNKINIQTFDIEILASFRDLYHTLPKEPVCVVDIGSATTKINIFDKSGLHFSYSNMIAGDVITAELVAKLKIKEDVAEEEKKTVGLNGKSKKSVDIIKVVVDYILQDIKNSLDYFEKENNAKVAEIVFLGGSSKLPGLVEYATEKLGVATKLGQSKILQKDINLEYIEVIGLALRGLDKNWDKKDPEIVWQSESKKKNVLTKEPILVEDKVGDENIESGVVSDDGVNNKNKKQLFLLLAILLTGALFITGSLWYRSNKKDSQTQTVVEQQLADLDKLLNENQDLLKEDIVVTTTVEIVTTAKQTAIIEETGFGYLNTRQGPGVNYEIVKRVNVGEEFPVLGQEGGWTKLELDENSFAWVIDDYVRITEEVSTTTIQQ